MKMLLKTQLATLLALFTFNFVTMPVLADKLVVIISPHQDSKIIQQQFTTVADAFYKMGHGDTLNVLNGEDASTMAVLENPQHEAFISAKSRKNFNRKAISAFRKKVENLNTRKRTGSINLPRVLTDLARYHTDNKKSGNRNIIIIGSPIFDAHSAYDMRTGLLPSDSHLLASTKQSLFGTEGHERQLNGLRVHWWLIEPLTPYIYTQAVQRFYHLYIHQQGATLISFTHDKDTVFRLLLSSANGLTLPNNIKNDGKLYMKAIRDYQIAYHLYEEPVSAELPFKQVWQTPQLLKVGIQWQATQGANTYIDLDIHSKTLSGEVLFYAQTSTTQGKFYKDERTDSNDNTYYETIEFYQPVDVSKLIIAINVYHANATVGDIRGTLRLALANKFYAKPFQFKASVGNQGGDIAAVLTKNGINTRYSKRFSVMDIVGLAKVKDETVLTTVH